MCFIVTFCMQITNFYKSFSKNILLYMSSWLLKIRSVHAYDIPRTVYFGWICRPKNIYGISVLFGVIIENSSRRVKWLGVYNLGTHLVPLLFRISSGGKVCGVSPPRLDRCRFMVQGGGKLCHWFPVISSIFLFLPAAFFQRASSSFTQITSVIDNQAW